MKIKNVMIFTYDFPHKKTQDFILRLFCEGYNIKYAIAAPWRKLNIPKSDFRFSPIHEGLVSPKKLCNALNVPYLVLEHDCESAVDFLSKNPVDLYVIAGARVLSKEIINTSNNRILNIHPGLLPQMRGLDTLPWSIYEGLPIGITAHLINSTVDSGMLIYKEKITLREEDAIIDVSLRLMEKQSDVLIRAINILKENGLFNLKNLDLVKGKYHSKISAMIEKEVVKKFPSWIKKYAN